MGGRYVNCKARKGETWKFGSQPSFWIIQSDRFDRSAHFLLVASLSSVLLERHKKNTASALSSNGVTKTISGYSHVKMHHLCDFCNQMSLQIALFQRPLCLWQWLHVKFFLKHWRYIAVTYTRP